MAAGGLFGPCRQSLLGVDSGPARAGLSPAKQAGDIRLVRDEERSEMGKQRDEERSQSVNQRDEERSQ